MTAKEYEQKKHECWIDLALDAANMNKVTVEEYKRIFNGVFDKAYALGKEKDTITQEEIERAWQDYAKEIGLPDSLNYATKPMIEIAIKQSFKAGAKIIGKQETKQETKQEKDADTVIQGWVARDDGER